MTNAHDEPHDRRVPDDSGIEALLRQVGAREEPSTAMMAEVEAAVHAEWQTMVAQRQRRRSMGWGMAASFVVVVAAAALGLRYLNGSSPVATIADVDGHVLVASGGGLMSSEQWGERASGQQVMKGERIQTDDRSRAALSVGGLSLRLDHNTTLRVAALDKVVLETGALYVDSPPAADGNTADRLDVETHSGTVRHVGTQYQVRSHADDIEVSVREGRVTIINAAYTSTGLAGERIRLTSQGEVSRDALSPLASDWQWVAEAAPPFDIDNRPLSDFLRWVARETGRRLVYASAQAQAAAEGVRLRGSIAELDPDTALNAVLATTQLRRYETKDESIGITLATPVDSTPANRPTP
jgi:ferric-dicitrate binding protein FerR (iron transport regulator)